MQINSYNNDVELGMEIGRTIPTVVLGVPCNIRIVDSDEVDAIYPVDPVTGHRVTDIERLMSNTISKDEADTIMSRLQQIRDNSSTKLTDDEILSAIPSKYINSPSDRMAWIEYVNSVLPDAVMETPPAETPPAEIPPAGIPSSQS